MCGIAGIFHLHGGSVERSRLERMGLWLQHRGPDAQGVHLQQGLGLVHRRLSIIDLDPRSHQPMHIEHCWLVYNGEIFNYPELRAELETLGHSFRTESDSEVLIRAYLQWGRECLNRFNGMWAFALWDEHQQALWCARDRFGVKPFYYVLRDQEFRFASEPKALLGDDPGLRRVNWRALGRYLVEGITDDEPETCFADVRPLPAAHDLWLRPGQELQFRRYWQLTPGLSAEAGMAIARSRLEGLQPPACLSFEPAQLPEPLDPACEEAAEVLRHLLQDAVRLRLRSDVPVGTCLSGGTDSSALVAFAAAQRSQPIRTFSSDYQEADCSESAFIQAVVEGCGTQATRLIPRPEELPGIMERLVWHQDEPTASAALFTQWKVMQSAHGSVTVLLDGQGGDELFAGYLPYFEDFLWDQVMASRENEEIGPAQEVCQRNFSRWVAKARWQRRLPRFLRKREKFKPDPYTPPHLLREELRQSMLGLDRSRTPRDPAWPGRLSRRLAHDLAHLSIPQLLRYEDRNSMAFSLEARTPFLDYRVVEFAFSLPNHFKLQRGWTKFVLRRALQGHLPPQVVGRRDKKGYPTPASHWFRGPLKEWLAEHLFSPEAEEWFQRSRLQRLFDQHQSGQDMSWDLWRVLHVLVWKRQFIEGKAYSS